MKKRISVVLMVVVLLMVSSISAFAAIGEVDPVIEALVDKANEEIDNLVDVAKLDAEPEDLSNKDLMGIIVELKKETRAISKSAIKDARDIGFNDIHCYFMEVEIGDKIVKIDPLVVGGW